MLLKEWRWLNKVEQKELAEKLGFSQSMVSKIEVTGNATEEFKSAFKEVFGKSAYSKIKEFVA